METLFENAYTDTEKIVIEGCRERWKIIRWIYISIFAIYTAIFFCGILAREKLSYWIWFFVCAGMFFYCLFLPKIQTKRYFRHMKRYYNGSIPETRVVFTDIDIETQFGKDCVHMQYDKITKVYFLKNTIILRAGKVSSVTLVQDRFTKGTKKDFVEFLRGKCPNLKLHDRK